MLIHIRSGARCEILIVTFYICTRRCCSSGLKTCGQRPRCFLWCLFLLARSWRGRGGAARFHGAALSCLHSYVALFILESLFGGLSERVAAVATFSL